MTAVADNVVPLTGNPLIDGLTWGAAWQFGGGAQVLTYSLSLNDNPNGGAWNTTMSNAVRAALAAWSNVANISFVESGSGTVYTQSTADLAFILTGNELQTEMPGAVGVGLPPSPSLANAWLAAGGGNRSVYPQPEGDVALDNYYSGFSYTSPGGVGLTILLHEIGHALGLKHTNSTYDGRPSFGSLGIANLDSNLYTVMSYTDPSGSQIGTSPGSGNAATPMPLDVLAIQQIYGANGAYHPGDDFYQLVDAGAVQTIWDAGGSDTVSASNVGNTNVAIDLRAGHYSQVGSSSTRLGIAYNVAIENALGGTGSDVLIGNDVGNRLDGGAGNDTMSGGGGDDVYIVDASGDIVTEFSAEGLDEIFSMVSYALPGNVENLYLTGIANVVGTGNELDNILSGNSGSNVLTGGFGSDTLSGGAGNDTLNGGFGLDVAVFSGARTGYSISRIDNVFIVDDINSANGDDGTDALSGIERIQFADSEVGVPAGSGMRIGHVAYPANWLEYYTVADLNGDGKTDISWLTRGGVAGIWTIDGENTWNPATMGSPFAGWTTVDNNGDGRADVALQHTLAGGTIQWNTLSIPTEQIPSPPFPPANPVVPPPPPTLPPPTEIPVLPPPPPPPPDWGL